MQFYLHQIQIIRIFIICQLGISYGIPHSYETASFSCDGNLLLRYPIPPQNGDNGFRLFIVGDQPAYQPSQDYIVTLQSALPTSFRGFAIRFLNEDGSSAGNLEPLNSHLTNVMPNCSHVATHSNGGKKTRVQVRWRTPTTGCVYISASVFLKGSIWFKDSDQLTIRICEENSTSTISNTSISCCACGNATYRMTFYGLWSPQTHPIDYPVHSTHWSNIIGASHSSNYIIWEYGGYASEGVQKVAEWGWIGNLEEEIRAQNDENVFSVIKTKAQWPAFQPRNLREPPSDDFQVDTSRNYVSLLTMLGPSPDWNVGLSKISMCTDDCGWIGVRKFDLIPWDAGTDSGVTYMSANSPTVPHEKIRNLTSLDNPRSPFYNSTGESIPPVARVVIRRLRTEGNQCGENEAVDFMEESTTNSNVFNADGDSSVTCMYGEWLEWSDCGVTCGWGIKMRKRMVKLNFDSSLCDSTIEKEICKGAGQCGNLSEATVCLYSEWASWSSCVLTCGNSTRFRTRMLKWPSELENCQEPLKEMTRCIRPTCSCVYSPWSAWIKCPVTCGVGLTRRKRILMTVNRHCTEPLIETSDCMTSMFCHSNDIAMQGCQYTSWSDWSSCPVTCGIAQSIRKRLLMSSMINSCKEFIMDTSKCMTSSSCPVECEYSDWSEWMQCSRTCGVGETLRKRFLAGGEINNCQNVDIERVSCHNGPCHNKLSQKCVYLPWSGWMPCSVSCGKGKTIRKRFLSSSVSFENCQSFEMESNFCMVACEVDASAQCSYSEWTSWGGCRRSCKTKRRKLIRSVENRAFCDRVIQEERKCLTPSCQSSCVLSRWSAWSSCNNICSSSLEIKYQFRTKKPLNTEILTVNNRSCRSRRQRKQCRC